MKDTGAQLTTVNGDNHIDIDDTPSRETGAIGEENSETKGTPPSTSVEQPPEVPKPATDDETKSAEKEKKVTAKDIMGWLTTFDIASPLRALENMTFIFFRGGTPLASSIFSNVMKAVIDRNLIVYEEFDSDVANSLS